MVNAESGVIHVAEAAVEYTAAQYDASTSVETDAVMLTGPGGRVHVVVACDAAAIGPTGGLNAANGVAIEAVVEYTAAQYDVSANAETDAVIPPGIGVVAQPVMLLLLKQQVWQMQQTEWQQRQQWSTKQLNTMCQQVWRRMQ